MGVTTGKKSSQKGRREKKEEEEKYSIKATAFPKMASLCFSFDILEFKVSCDVFHVSLSKKKFEDVPWEFFRPVTGIGSKSSSVAASALVG